MAHSSISDSKRPSQASSKGTRALDTPGVLTNPITHKGVLHLTGHVDAWLDLLTDLIVAEVLREQPPRGPEPAGIHAAQEARS